MSTDLIWFDHEKLKEHEVVKEVYTSEEIVCVKLKYTVVSSNAIKLKIGFERIEVRMTEAESREAKEEEDRVRNKIQIWMKENFI